MTLLRSIFKPADTDSASLRAVQSCITNVNFPKTIPDLHKMVTKNQGLGSGATDLEVLLNFKPKQPTDWTAPRWITMGDVLWFYHAISAKRHIASLRRQLEQTTTDVDLAPVLDHASVLAEKYAGTIFACAEVAGPTAYLSDEDELLHFKNRIFAPLAQVHCFSHPLPVSCFEQVVKISRQSSITPLSGDSFDRLKQLAGENNRLPDFLRRARSGDVGFQNVNSSNWRAVSCAPGTHFIHEAQLRAYLLDYLLEELKDARTPRLEECLCECGGKKMEFVDYMIQLNGQWVPIEAKLNMLAEPNIYAQVAKYIHIDQFTPTKGVDKNKRSVADASICLVMDQSGIYVVSDGTFIGGQPGDPLVTRRELAALTIPVLRKKLRAYIGG